MSLEIFKPIKDFPGYQISSWGRVYSEKTGTYIRPEVMPKGYLRVDLFNEEGRKHCKVHRLVAEAFIPNPECKPHLNHRDGNNQNNSFINLEWCTNDENVAAAKKLRDMQKESA